MTGILFAVVLGVCIGSFVNAVIWRLHTGESFFRGRSKCIHCQVEIKAYDLLPVASYIILRGACRACGEKIPWRYPVIEAMTALLYVLAYCKFMGLSVMPSGEIAYWVPLLQLWLAIPFLMIIFVYDALWQFILDKVTLPAIFLFVLYNGFLMADPAFTGGTAYPEYSWANIALAGILGGGFFLVQYILSRGTWIGGGDIRMGVLMGVMLGFPHVLVGLFLAYGLGSCYGIALLASKKKSRTSEIAFGTFLALATCTVLFFYDETRTLFAYYIGNPFADI